MRKSCGTPIQFVASSVQIALISLLFLGWGCGSESTECSAKNCKGCCSASNVCLDGKAMLFCGSGGLACSVCSPGFSCETGACLPIGQGTGGGSGGGTATGGSGGGAGGSSSGGGVGGGNIDGGFDGGQSAPCNVQPPGAPQPGLCADGGFCWVNPTPLGGNWKAVWAVSETEAWVAGRGGYVAHVVNGTLTAMPRVINTDIVDLWGSGPNDVWAVSNGVGRTPGSTLIHWTGTQWLPTSHQSAIRSVWGSGPNDVWFADATYLKHFDGSTYTNIDLPFNAAGGTMRNLGGYAAGEVWGIVSIGPAPYEPKLFRYSGGVYDLFPSPPGGKIRTALVVSPTEIYVSDATSTYRATISASSLNYVATVGPASDDLFRSADGKLWNCSNGPVELINKQWTEACSVKYPLVDGCDMHGSGNTVWSVGTAIYRRTSGTWNTLTFTHDQQPFTTVWAPSGSQVFIGSAFGNYKYSNGQFSPITATTSQPSQIHGSSPDNVWISDYYLSTVQLRADGGFNQYNHAERLSGVWVGSESAVWTFGDKGFVSRFNGTQWDSLPLPRLTDGGTDPVTAGFGFLAAGTYAPGTYSDAGFSGNIPEVMWVGTRSGKLWRWTSNKWALNNYSSGGDPVISIWGATPTDLWAVDNSNVGHLTSTTWSYSSNLLFRQIYGSGSRDVWAVDYLGQPWRWNGTTWAEAPMPSGPQLLDIAVTPDGGVWTVGTGGALLKKGP